MSYSIRVQKAECKPQQNQRFALSPLLFITVMYTISGDLQKKPPWSLLYADDVMLACEDKKELEKEVQAWCDRLAAFGLRLNVGKTELCGERHERLKLHCDQWHCGIRAQPALNIMGRRLHPKAA